jgi:hypothetical protein
MRKYEVLLIYISRIRTENCKRINRSKLFGFSAFREEHRLGQL